VGERAKPSDALAANRAAIRHVVESHRARNVLIPNALSDKFRATVLAEARRKRHREAVP
jgi:hypothetical protein